MRRVRIQWVIALTSLCAVGPITASAKDSLEQCRQLHVKIEHYEELRRQGGSGAQMDAWKRSRRKLEKRFRDLGCRYYRGQLE